MDATFWVGVGFVIFAALLVYLKVPAMLVSRLDERAQRIRKELEEAERLRDEAQALLASYERRQREAQKEAEAMLVHAREEAQREAASAERKLAEQIARREQQALEKIRLAEAQAEKDVREQAVELAIRATRAALAQHLDAARDTDIVDQAIRDLRRQLN
ncbi:MAG: ATP F0F1 synthase subunit B [Alphaproteobacteria bacterium]|nr:ATP F0F1 synthase subunit B [Alphaproteobacteria bacterium]